ncbi:MAG: hypothetical protein ACK5Z2_17155 [Bacteroidota bacterium]|jgi:hypothetical protein
MALFSKTPGNNHEFARVLEWSPQWDTGAPMPQVFSNGRKIFLIYLIREVDPNWDGTFTTLIDNTSDIAHSLALVEFDGNTFRFGIANDEVFSGLPLWNKGLDAYSAHQIENSTWINELKKINKVHPRYNEDSWIDLKHFALLFHDEILEVIATDYTIEIFNTTFAKLAGEVARRMNC